MGFISVNSRMIHGGMLGSSDKVVYGVFDNLELWRILGNIVAREAFDGILKTRSGILHSL